MADELDANTLSMQLQTDIPSGCCQVRLIAYRLAVFALGNNTEFLVIANAVTQCKVILTDHLCDQHPDKQPQCTTGHSSSAKFDLSSIPSRSMYSARSKLVTA